MLFDLSRRLCFAAAASWFRASGELRPGIDPDQATVTFIALMDGLQVQWLTTPDAVDLVASLRFYLQSLLTVPLD